jgi:hypothetical protein
VPLLDQSGSARDQQPGNTQGVPGWAGIVIGCALLALVVSDAANISNAWRSPARWWKPVEYWRSRQPSQPLNIVLGITLGIAALVYGIISLIR